MDKKYHTPTCAKGPNNYIKKCPMLNVIKKNVKPGLQKLGIICFEFVNIILCGQVDNGNLTISIVDAVLQ